MNTSKRKQGNVLFIILIAVALFAALSYAMTSSSRGSGQGVTKEKALLSASQIIRFATTINKNASDMMMYNKCRDDQISYLAPANHATLHGNGTAPPDKSCHLFDPAGGRTAMIKVDENWLDEDLIPYVGNYGYWVFTNINNSQPDRYIVNIGSSEAETQLRLNAVKPEICKAINEILKYGWGDTIPFDENAEIGDTAGAEFAGKPMGCRENPASGQTNYQFYNAIIIR